MYFKVTEKTTNPITKETKEISGNFLNMPTQDFFEFFFMDLCEIPFEKSIKIERIDGELPSDEIIRSADGEIIGGADV